MTDRPIIFSAPMVRALLDGTKTQTRRVLKPQPDLSFSGIFKDDGRWWTGDDEGKHIQALPVRYAISDRLWVRENWNVFSGSQDGETVWPLEKIPTKEQFDAVNDEGCRGIWQVFHTESDHAHQWLAGQKWRPSIHMPRLASRLTLTVSDVRVERLQDISEGDAIAEGIKLYRLMGAQGWTDYSGKSGDNIRRYFSDPRESFRTLWNHINGPDAWEANPWVVAVSFEVHQCNIDQMGKQQEAT